MGVAVLVLIFMVGSGKWFWGFGVLGEGELRCGGALHSSVRVKRICEDNSLQSRRSVFRFLDHAKGRPHGSPNPSESINLSSSLSDPAFGGNSSV